MNAPRSFLIFIIIFFVVFACQSPSSKTEEQASVSLLSDTPIIEEVSVDLPEIMERDTLKAILTYSSSSYFIYRGEPMGYEYELVKRMADHLGLNLKIIVAPNMDEMFNMLKRGEGDLIAHGLTITQARKEEVAFTTSHNYTQQILVQRKPENWRSMKLHEIDQTLIKSPVELIGKTVSVRGASAYYDRLENLQDEIGGEIEIDVVSGEYTTDELIEKVATGEIPYTIADEYIALINQTYYDQIDIRTSVSLTQQLAWALRKSSPDLLAAINEWVERDKKLTDFHVIYNKYFKNKREFRSRMKSDFYSRTGGKLSPYDEDIQHHATILDWDWLLLASLMYQESHFDPNTKSWAGARGLMQVMPATGREFGASNLYNPSENMRAGTAFLKRLQAMWEQIPDSLDRLKFTLASYNAGPGHVMDAQRLARKLGKDPQIWDEHVAECMLLKSRPEYFNDEVVKYGYCRGKEPYNYVQKILGRYEQYKQFLN